MKLKKGIKEREGEPQISKSDSRRKPTTRTIEICWIHQDKGGAKQVRAKQGGGTRTLVMDISGGFNDILEEGKRLFSQVVFQVKAIYQTSHLMYGTLSRTLFLMMSQLAKCMTLSIGKMYDTVKLPTLSLKQNHNPVKNPLPLSLNTGMMIVALRTRMELLKFLTANHCLGYPVTQI